MHPFGIRNTSQKWPLKASREEGYQWNTGIPTKPQLSYNQGSKIKTPQTSLLWFKEQGCRPLMAWGVSWPVLPALFSSCSFSDFEGNFYTLEKNNWPSNEAYILKHHFFCFCGLSSRRAKLAHESLTMYLPAAGEETGPPALPAADHGRLWPGQL